MCTFCNPGSQRYGGISWREVKARGRVYARAREHIHQAKTENSKTHIAHTHSHIIVWSDWNRATIISFSGFFCSYYYEFRRFSEYHLFVMQHFVSFSIPSPSLFAVFTFLRHSLANRTQFHIWKSLGQIYTVTHLIVTAWLACNRLKLVRIVARSTNLLCAFIEQIALFSLEFNSRNGRDKYNITFAQIKWKLSELVVVGICTTSSLYKIRWMIFATVNSTWQAAIVSSLFVKKWANQLKVHFLMLQTISTAVYMEMWVCVCVFCYLCSIIIRVKWPNGIRKSESIFLSFLLLSLLMQSTFTINIFIFDESIRSPMDGVMILTTESE